ncbi:unnamed protein product [Phytophthora lilii]|uniref:Unnamed protein product n=1 Tax=Phytophthora lilii TaxID=2077276 RepID=A0A9W6X9V8_9STRA|nr:unnamed protein product [Phytophthora lilii]
MKHWRSKNIPFASRPSNGFASGKALTPMVTAKHGSEFIVIAANARVRVDSLTYFARRANAVWSRLFSYLRCNASRVTDAYRRGGSSRKSTSVQRSRTADMYESSTGRLPESAQVALDRLDSDLLVVNSHSNPRTVVKACKQRFVIKSFNTTTNCDWYILLLDRKTFWAPFKTFTDIGWHNHLLNYGEICYGFNKLCWSTLCNGSSYCFPTPIFDSDDITTGVHIDRSIDDDTKRKADQKRPTVRVLITEILQFWLCEIFMGFLYSGYFHIFSKLSRKVQTPFALLLPVMKVFMRNLLAKTA